MTMHLGAYSIQDLVWRTEELFSVWVREEMWLVHNSRRLLLYHTQLAKQKPKYATATNLKNK